MKKYLRSELHKALTTNCNPWEICEEVYATIDQTGMIPTHTSDLELMKILRRKVEAFQKNKMDAAVLIIHRHIPVLVIYSKKVEMTVDEETGEITGSARISELHFPFKNADGNTIYKIFDIREILDVLSEDDYDARTPLRHIQSHPYT